MAENKKLNPNEVKLVYVHSKPVMLTGILSGILFLLAVAMLFIPFLTANYNDGGVTHSYSVSALDIASAFIGAPTSNMSNFSSVLTADFSSVDNPIVALIVANFTYIALGLLGILILPLGCGIHQLINVVKFVFKGEAHNLKTPKRFAKLQFLSTLLVYFVYLLFAVAFQEVLHVVSLDHSVTHPFFFYPLLFVNFGLWIALIVIHEVYLRDRVFVSKNKNYKPNTTFSYKESANTNKSEEPSKSVEEAPMKPDEPLPNEQQQIVEEINVKDDKAPADHSSEA